MRRGRLRALRIYRVLETLVVPRNVRDSRFRREPYRKRKRASTYISPIHAERPTNDAVRMRGERGMRPGEDVGPARVGVRREVYGRYEKKGEGKKEKKSREKGKSAEKKGEKAGRGPLPTSTSRTISFWDIVLEGDKGKDEKHGNARARSSRIQGLHILINARIRLYLYTWDCL